MKIIGHRGAKGLAPENTLKSFEKALEHQVDEIECDIRVTKDGIAVLEHDARLEIPGLNIHVVADHTLAELQKIRPDLPTLEDAITFLNQRAVLQIEVKPKESIEPVVSTVQKFLDQGWSAEAFIISSRDFKVLQKAKSLAPHIPLSIIHPWSSILAVSRARRLGTKRISMNEHVLWPPLIDAMARRGYLLCGYTMDDPKRARAWAKHGLHAVITDYPDVFQKSKLH
jgi:glycerophosphoryl diester phosphodiesterase